MPASSVLERLVVEIIGDTGKLKTALAEAQRLTTEFTSKTRATAAIGASGTGLGRAASEASAAEKAITGLRTGLDLLIADQRLGNVTAAEYATELKEIASGAQDASREFTLTASQMKRLATVATTAAREETSLGKASASVKDRVQQLSNEVRILRNNWQQTGADTNAVKARLAALASESLNLQKDLLAADGGFQKFNAEIARLATAGRSAEATIAGIGNRMSRLGLASQVNLAATQTMQMQLYRFGPVGMVAAGAMSSMTGAALGAAAAVGGLGLAAGALIREGIPQVKEMQQSLQLLAATGNPMTMQQLADGLDAAAAAAGKAGTQFTRGELSTGLAQLVKAGLSASDAFKLLAPSMQLAVESGQSFEQASTLLLTNLRQFALPITDASEAAKALGVSSLRARDNAQALSEGLATVGPIAQQAGLSIDQTLAALVTLSNKGLNAADIGARGLRTSITHLINPSAKAQKALEQFGVSVKDAAGHQRSFDGILGDVIKAANGYGISIDKATGKVVGQHDAIALLAQIVGQRGLSAIAGMAAAQDDATNSWQANTDAITKSNESLKGYADTLLSSNLAASQKALDTSFKNLGETLTVTFAPALVTSADALSNLLDQYDRALNTRGFWGTIGESLLHTWGGLLGGPGNITGLASSPPAYINKQGGVGANPYGPPARPSPSSAGAPKGTSSPDSPKGTANDPVKVKLTDPAYVGLHWNNPRPLSFESNGPLPSATAGDVVALNRWPAGQTSFATDAIRGVSLFSQATRDATMQLRQFDDTLRGAWNPAAPSARAWSVPGAARLGMLHGAPGGPPAQTAVQYANALLRQADAAVEAAKAVNAFQDSLHTLSSEGRAAAVEQADVAGRLRALREANQLLRHGGWYDLGAGVGGIAAQQGPLWAARGNNPPYRARPTDLGYSSGYNPSLDFIFGLGTQDNNAGKGASKATESLKSLASAAQQVSQAFSGFESGLKAFSQGDVGAGVSGIASGIGTGLGAIGGLVGDATLGPIGVLVGVFGGLFGGLVDAISGNTQAVKQNTEAMLANVPTGFKVAGYAFNAAQPTAIHIQAVNIQSNDPAATWKAVKREMQREAYLRTGSTQGAY